jgi:acetate kinase
MGLTPLEGLVMGTRSGDIDPGVLGYMGHRLGLDVDGVLDVLNHSSGLLGLSGHSNDMRTLEQDGSPDAELAIEVFCYRAAKTVGALAVALGGLDVLVFTGGIGEHSRRVRATVVERLGVLGLRLDPEANEQNAPRISAEGATPVVLVVPTDEERLIAADTLELTG